MSKHPHHKKEIQYRRRAVAPYNFVPLPKQVISAEDAGAAQVTGDTPTPHLVRHDSYHAERHTGEITATLITRSPLYTRTGLTPEAFATIAKESFSNLSPEDKQRYAAFFALNQIPTIPGSSLRGMLRTLIEIVTQSKVGRVTNQDRFFYRAVAALDDDPLAKSYKQAFNHRNVRAGYLVQQDGTWWIRPAQEIDGTTVLWAKKNDLTCPSLIPLDSDDYHPQCITVTFQQTFLDRTRKRFADGVQENGKGAHKGCMVTSGNMAETGESQNTRRKNYCVVPEQDRDAVLLPIDATAIEDYRASLTDFQKEHFNGAHGILQDGRPVFYLSPARNPAVLFFGHSPYFRIPYRFDGATRAASPHDFVPPDLRDPAVTDMAEALFGYVPTDNGDRSDQRPAYAGRVFVNDAPLDDAQRGSNVNLPEAQPYMVPRILSSPKPTTFQHYLVQPEDDLHTLKHYASTPTSETVIRGHKLYWHQGHTPDWHSHLRNSDTQPGAEGSQHTGLCPVKPDTRFALCIRFENLSNCELGALLWVLRLANMKDTAASADHYALKLGMGKSLGMGSVQIENLTVQTSKREQRYTKLFATDEHTHNTWATGEQPQDEQAQDTYVQAFKAYVQQHSGESAASFEDLPRVTTLYHLLRWPGPPSSQTRMMEIERDTAQAYVPDAKVRNNKANEYANRPVLPTPADVLGLVVSEEEQKGGGQPTLNTDLRFKGTVASIKRTYYLVTLLDTVWGRIGIQQAAIQQVRLAKKDDMQKLGVGASTPNCVAEKIDQGKLFIRPAPKKNS